MRKHMTKTMLRELRECPLLTEPLQWAKLERPKPLITWNPLWSFNFFSLQIV